MTFKKFEDSYEDIGAGLSDEGEAFPKKPLAKDFYEAEKGSHKTLFELQVIFSPKEPYNAYGIVTHAYRGNIRADSAFGQAFEAALERCMASGEALCAKYDETRATKFTIVVSKRKKATYKEKSWGIQVIPQL